ncbi:MAG TPA: DUF1080 domain-containing protein [Isosphaeraceae bacterium]|jgi:hypothetical protein|nr:DUF1080 domain-containing protein [Isosphaeraceae bacterium]
MDARDRFRAGRWARAAAIAGLLTTGLGADEPKAEKPGKIVLFDGKSLDGWKATDFHGADKVEVTVKDGMIVLPVGHTMTGITCTRKDLPRTDYELSYEAQRLEGRDFFAAATFPVGASYVTLVNGGWGGNVTGLSSLDGADASENDTSKYVKYRDKTWYKFRVRVTDRSIRCWIDDKPVVAVDHKGRTLSTRIEVRKNHPLGFATWETAGALRAIEVRPLTAAEVAATNTAD